MCLENVFKGKEKKDFINSLDIRVDGFIWLWKAFRVTDRGYLVADFNGFNFYDGKNTAECKRRIDAMSTGSYIPNFHCFTTKRSANNYAFGSELVVPVKVKKSWITAVGRQQHKDAVVCKYIII